MPEDVWKSYSEEYPGRFGKRSGHGSGGPVMQAPRIQGLRLHRAAIALDDPDIPNHYGVLKVAGTLQLLSCLAKATIQ